MLDFITERLTTTTNSLIAVVLLMMILSVWRGFVRRIASMWRRFFGSYPARIRDYRGLSIDSLLDAVRYAGTKVKGWDKDAAIIGLNRGGAIMAGLLAKFVDHNRIGLVDFSVRGEPKLMLPNSLTKDSSNKPNSIVLIDDRFHTGSTAEKGIELIKANYPQARIFYICLISNRENIQGSGIGTGGNPLADVSKSLVLFVPKRTETRGDLMLPWDREGFREDFQVRN